VDFALPQIEIRTRADDCYHVLKSAIVTLQLPPGSVIDESAVASQLGVSKTPVREALARLSGEGFVESASGRRTRVSGLSADSIREVIEIRLMVESASLPQAAAHLDEGDFSFLRATVEQAATARASADLVTFVNANAAFHTRLIERAGNARLARVYRGLSDQADRVRAMVFQIEHKTGDRSIGQRGLARHRSIIDALIATDVDLAVERIGNDIREFAELVAGPTMRHLTGEDAIE
jgi:GntR family transcriptional regulator, rspAB operon transcriptional repressor